MFRIACRKSFNSIEMLKKGLIMNNKQMRYLNLLEYQSKELLRDCGVSVQNFALVDDLKKANSALESLR